MRVAPLIPWLIAVASPVLAASVPDESIDIGTRPQLFVNDYLVKGRDVRLEFCFSKGADLYSSRASGSTSP